MSFVGSIVGTQGEQVEVAFDIDKTAAGGNRYGFAPATGTKTSLYIGNGDEAQGIATGCIRTNGSTCEGTGSPEKKKFPVRARKRNGSVSAANGIGWR